MPELTALQRDEHIARWLELEKARVSAQVVQKPQGGRPEGGRSAAAREIGVNRESARRAEIVAGLSSEAKDAARSVGLDNNRSALLEAARELTPEAQVSAIQRRYQAKLADHPLSDGVFGRWPLIFLQSNRIRIPGSDCSLSFLENCPMECE